MSLDQSGPFTIMIKNEINNKTSMTAYGNGGDGWGFYWLAIGQ